MGQRLRQFRPKPKVHKSTGPFVGMKDGIDIETDSPNFARRIEDMLPDIGEQGAGLIGKPSAVAIDTTGVPAGEYHISDLKRTGRAPEVVLIGASGIWVKSTGAWTQVVTATDTPSLAGDIFTEQFGDLLVVNVSGAGEKPWTFDSSATGAAAISSLTAAPISFGQPVVHYGKLFFIKQGATQYDRRTIVWSEEAKPNEGYDSGGYNNAWDLRQVDEDPLFALYPTNKALYYFRQSSIGAIFGEVTINFSSTGVDDAISETVGTPFPASILRVDTVRGTQIWFLDERNRPYYLTVGGTLTPAWKDFKQTIDDSVLLEPGQDIARQRSWFLPRADVIGMPLGGPSTPSSYMVFDAETSQPLAVWNGTFLHPIVIYEGTEAGELWFADGSGVSEVSGPPKAGGMVETPALYEDNLSEVLWERMDFMGRGQEVPTAVTITPITPYGEQTAIALDQNALTPAGITLKESVGLDFHGRWIRFRFANLPANIGLSRVLARGAIYDDDPGAP